MRTLIYKRTHHGDPDVTGQFGIYDCMGRVRAWNFEAVIGVGGVGAEPTSHGLDGKVNWIYLDGLFAFADSKKVDFTILDRVLYVFDKQVNGKL